MNSASSGSSASPSRASSSERRTIFSNSASDSGLCQPAMRTARNAAPAIRTAIPATPRTRSSTTRTAPIVLKPWPTTITTSPSDSAISAATPIRLIWPEAPGGLDARIAEDRGPARPYLNVRAITSRWISFVPS